MTKPTVQHTSMKQFCFKQLFLKKSCSKYNFQNFEHFSFSLKHSEWFIYAYFDRGPLLAFSVNSI